MSTYGTPGAGYGETLGTYGDLKWGLAPEGAPVPTPTYATGAVGRTAIAGAAARTAVSGSDGRSTVVGPTGTTLTTGHRRVRVRERIG